MIASRAYVDDDLPHLQSTIACWTLEAGDRSYCHVGELPHRIYENLRGRHPVGDVVHVWHDGSETVGLAINLRHGQAFDVFTAPSLRGSDAELAMLRSAYETTSRYSSVVVADVVRGDDTRAELLMQLAFEEYRVWDHITERALTEPVASVEVAHGFTIRSARSDDADQLARARNSAFDEDWTGESYRSHVMEKPGYDAAREIVVVAPDGSIVAFTVVWMDELNHIGHFEPVGTHREFQRKGLARAAMVRGLQVLQDAGMRTATVEYDATNIAAAELYRTLGFAKKYETVGFRRNSTQ